MLQGFFDAMGAWPVSQAIGASIWIYPLIQAIHLVFLAFFAGGIIIVDLRLLGYGMRSKSIAQVARDARPWMIMGFLGLVATGLPQLMQNASREYFSEFFWYKMYLIALRPDLPGDGTPQDDSGRRNDTGHQGRRTHLDGDLDWCDDQREVDWTLYLVRVSGTFPRPAASRNPPRATAEMTVSAITVQINHHPGPVPRSSAIAFVGTRFIPRITLRTPMASTTIPATIHTFRFMRYESPQFAVEAGRL